MEFIYKCEDLFFKGDLKKITTLPKYIKLHFKSSIETRRFYDLFSHTDSKGVMYIDNADVFYRNCYIKMIKVDTICVYFHNDSWGMDLDAFNDIIHKLKNDCDNYLRKEKLEIILS